MNGDGQHFAMSERPTLFTVSVTEGFYDEPISEPINSLGDVSSVVGQYSFSIIFAYS